MPALIIWTTEETTRIVEAYKGGQSAISLAVERGVHRSVINRVLCQEDVPPRGLAEANRVRIGAQPRLPRKDVAGQIFHPWRVLDYWGLKCYRGRKSVHLWRVECVNCGCLRVRSVHALRMAERLNQTCANCMMRPRGETGLNMLLGDYKAHAVEFGRPFLLTVEEFKALTSSPCFYCGQPPRTVRTANTYRPSGPRRLPERSRWGDYLCNGIDRVDNGGGYVRDNCVPCCPFCNRAKGGMPAADFIAHLDRIAAFRSRP